MADSGLECWFPSGLEAGPKNATFQGVVEVPLPLRVLVVDDDQHVARALTRMLRRFCLVEVASSVDEAEKRLSEEQEFALILCDLLLPQRGGLELYRGLRQKNAALARRVAFMTGLGDDATEALEFREVPCLGKPLDVGRIRELLNKA